MARQYQLTTTSTIAAVAFALVLLGVVGFFLAFGFVLVVGLVIASLLSGIGVALRRKLTGKPAPGRISIYARRGLDPANEVDPAGTKGLQGVTQRHKP